jgi:hypothetical protein
VHDHDVERAGLEGQRAPLRHVHVDQHARRLRGRPRAPRFCVARDSQRIDAAQPHFLRERADGTGIVDADLQQALAHAHAGHRDRKRLESRRAKE